MNRFANRIPKGTDTPLIINFDFDGEFAENGLNNFTDIKVDIGGEEYSTSTHSDLVFVQSSTQLRVKVGTVTNLEPGNHPIVITGYTAVEYDDGYEVQPFGSVEVA